MCLCVQKHWGCYCEKTLENLKCKNIFLKQVVMPTLLEQNPISMFTRRGSRCRPPRGPPVGGCRREETGTEAPPPAAPQSSLWRCSSSRCPPPSRSSSWCRRSEDWGCWTPLPRHHAWEHPTHREEEEEEEEEGQREVKGRGRTESSENLVAWCKARFGREKTKCWSAWNLSAGVNWRIRIVTSKSN